VSGSGGRPDPYIFLMVDTADPRPHFTSLTGMYGEPPVWVNPRDKDGRHVRGHWAIGDGAGIEVRIYRADAQGSTDAYHVATRSDDRRAMRWFEVRNWFVGSVGRVPYAKPLAQAPARYAGSIEPTGRPI